MRRFRWSDGPNDFAAPVPRAGAMVRQITDDAVTRRRGRQSPSPIEIGIAARFLAPGPRRGAGKPQDAQERRTLSQPVRDKDAHQAARAPAPAAKF
jgi:hypothetical protein